MSFTPTVFVNNQAPPLSAAEINKIGSGLQTVAAQVDDLVANPGFDREAVEEQIVLLLKQGANVTFDYVDNGTGQGTLTINSTGGGGGGTTDPFLSHSVVHIYVINGAYRMTANSPVGAPATTRPVHWHGLLPPGNDGVAGIQGGGMRADGTLPDGAYDLWFRE